MSAGGGDLCLLNTAHLGNKEEHCIPGSVGHSLPCVDAPRCILKHAPPVGIICAPVAFVFNIPEFNQINLVCQRPALKGPRGFVFDLQRVFKSSSLHHTAFMYDKSLQSGSGFFFFFPKSWDTDLEPSSTVYYGVIENAASVWNWSGSFPRRCCRFAVHTNHGSPRISVFRGFCLKAEINFPWHEAIAAALDTYWSVVFANVARCPKKKIHIRPR